MTFDDADQRNCPKKTIEFQPATTWMVFANQVSHTTLSGRQGLEQTVALDRCGMSDPEPLPLRVLARLNGQKLH